MAAVVGLCVLAAALRVVFLEKEVFSSDGVVLQGNDSWYHLRLAEHLTAHGFSPLRHDPLALHPGGQQILVAPGLDALVVAASGLVQWGWPSAGTVAEVAAWMPPVLAACTVAVLAILGAQVFGPAVGILAAALLALAPGPFLRYSVLGYADHHILEALLATLVILLLCRAARVGRAWQAVPAGFVLGAYLLTWVGGGFLIGLVSAWGFLALVAARESRPHALVHLLVTFAVAAAILLGFRGMGEWVDVHLAVLGAASLGAALLLAARRLARGTDCPGRVWVGAAVVSILAVVAVGRSASFGLDRFVQMIGWFAQGSRAGLVQEAAPLFSSTGGAWWRAAWEIFGPAGAMALVGLAAGWRRARRSADPAGLLVVVFGAVSGLATLAQQRFAYYAAIPAALLAALGMVALCGWMAGRGESPSPGRTRRAWASVILVALVCLGHHAWQARAIVTQPSGPPQDWREALRWLEANSPSPSATPYGVMCTWDRGYWVTALAKRAPNANPTQANAGRSAAYFLSEDEAEASAVLEALDARYVILDCTVPVWPGPGGRMSVGKVVNLAGWAGRLPSRYVEVVGATSEPRAPRILVFHPAYYRTMVARLFVFGAEGYAPQGEVLLVQLASRADGASGVGRFIRASRRFPDHDSAEAFIAEHAADGWQPVGLSPTESCVPLEALGRHRLVHRSPTTVAQRGDRPLGYVQIFEITRD